MEEGVSLKEHLEKLLSEKDKMINAVAAFQKQAVDVYEKNAEKWRESANEWRGTMDDKDKNYLTKAEFEAFRKEFETYKHTQAEALKVEKERDDLIRGKSEGRASGITQLLGWIAFAIMLIVFLINMFNNLK